MGALEGPDLARAGADGTVAFAAKQLQLHVVGAHHGGVGHDKRPPGPSRLAVNNARDDFLSRPCGASDENSSVGRCGPFGSHADLLDRRRRTDKLACFASPQLQFGDLAFQLCGLERARNGEQEAIAIQRLFDELVGALLDGGDGGVDRSVPADHDDGHLGVTVRYRLQDVHAIELASLQPDVENDQRRRRPRVDRFDRGGAVRRIAGRIASVLQDSGDRLAD